jgi:hypothetical protein
VRNPTTVAVVRALDRHCSQFSVFLFLQHANCNLFVPYVRSYRLGHLGLDSTPLVDLQILWDGDVMTCGSGVELVYNACISGYVYYWRSA